MGVSGTNSENDQLSNFVLPCHTSWKYRVEGAQKMVFYLNGEPAKPIVLFLYVQGTAGPTEYFQPLFRKNLSKYLLTHHIIQIPRHYSDLLLEMAKGERPKNRSESYKPQADGAFAFDELRRFGKDTIIVEIKPKSAVLSRSRLVAPKYATILGKYTTPVYFIKEYFCKGWLPKKLYHPADLLSGDSERMQQACDLLIEQDSRAIRVFMPGDVILQGMDISSSEDALQAVKAFVQVLHENTDLCAGIKAVQAADVVDIQGAEFMMRVLQDRLGDQEAADLVVQYLKRTEDDFDPYFDVQYENATKLITYESPKEAAQEHTETSFEVAQFHVRTMSNDVIARFVAEYVQAAAARDLCLFVSMTRKEYVAAEGSGDSPCCVSVDGSTWMYKAAVIDVGEKGIDRVTGKWPNVEKDQFEKMLHWKQRE